MVSTNYSVDLQGTPDTRPGTWGYAGNVDWRMPFYPGRSGYAKTKIVNVWGNWVAWTRDAAPAGKKSGLLFSLMATNAVASTDADFASTGCALFLQGATDGSPFTEEFHIQPVNFMLADDNVLIVRAAVFLNELATSIHIEPSFVIEYQFGH